MSALELGITPRTLRNWMGPVEKEGWEELQVSAKQAMDKLYKVAKTKSKKKARRKSVFA